jgi:membrane protein DedA with SNARE-associated domain
MLESLLQHLASLTPTAILLTLTGILLACGLGIPIPEDISLIAAGYLAHLGLVNVHTVFLVCFAAVLGGDACAFYLGRYFGRMLIQTKFSKRFFSPRKQLRVRAYFRKYGSKVIFVGRFLPGLRFSIFFSAGMLHVRAATFFIWDTLAAVLSVPALVYLAWYFGEHIDHVIAWARRSEYGILVIAAVAVAIVVLKSWRGRRARKASPAVAGPPVAP